VANRGWKRPFDDSVPLFVRSPVRTLDDAAKYIRKLPKAEQQLAEWQAAVEGLILYVDHNGPTMMAPARN
jgi:hypothetical protein